MILTFSQISLIQDNVLQVEKSISLIELIQSSGLAGQIIIGSLFVLLLIGIYIYLEEIPVARLISKGISRIGRPLEDINTAIENAGRLEIYKLEKNISILATISGASPMIGFLGTVIGMIISIFEISNAGGSIDMKLLSDGLYTAMTTTVAGLVVGIVGYICYNHLVVKISKVVYQMQASSLEFLDLLNEPVT